MVNTLHSNITTAASNDASNPSRRCATALTTSGLSTCGNATRR